jgi:pimeloyl-ACP methyl ester carboxylesterase
VSGHLDPRGTQRAAEVAQAIPGARHEIIRDAGHTPHIEAPERFLDLVTTALATSDVAASPIPTS